MTSLVDLLPSEAIDLHGHADDWRAAIRAAGDLLVATGVTTAEYTAEMIGNVETNGPYIVIAPGFAFAHARPSPAVRRTGMSWVRLEKPVEFDSPNDPVDLVVALAASDSGVHTDAMAALAKVLLEPGAEQLLRAVRTPRQLRALLLDETEIARVATEKPSAAKGSTPIPTVKSHSGPLKILTVCGNGVGTSLFLKSTLESVLDRWHWTPYITVEATDTISAKGKASEAVAVLTSGEIAKTLGNLSIPVRVIENFTSAAEVDGALRELFDL
ncbi:PTS sugar transporter subunit IIA [Nocardia sp. CDC160]|uniref:PTS sugar transporter subunit IIA n=1 Tax=Nocardia sp. CDC160 TaxID=3112166 RepID=UPI002DBCBD99|nr:PTS sugar transporter subunit IIA [Nocardia sp. CDC160]MEC3913144.1 PTS sugar transporter subunit IIA [Nocardia sp. CDC160]